MFKSAHEQYVFNLKDKHLEPASLYKALRNINLKKQFDHQIYEELKIIRVDFAE